MELRIFLKQTTQFNVQKQKIHFAGTSPYNLSAVQGDLLPTSRRWPNYGSFIDVTGDSSDLSNLVLEWTEDRDNGGNQSPGEFRHKKAASGRLVFEGQTFRKIKQWLFDDVSATVNSIDVKIQHVGWGWYEDYVILPTGITWCEDGNQTCEVTVTLRQRDDMWGCIASTVINDNHLGWFPELTRQSIKQHPRFSYCNEQRPNGLLVLAWWNGAVVWTISAALFFALYGIINTVIATIIIPTVNTINLIIKFINALGANIDELKVPSFFNPDEIVKDYEQKFIESGGCGREHPAPLIRDYIYNVCKKCGIDTDALEKTAPIFFSQTLHNWETSSRGVLNVPNPHYNACYFHAPIKRGVRRFEKIKIVGNTPMNKTDYWIPENAPGVTLDMFLDELKQVYNAEWRVRGDKLYFNRKDLADSNTVALDVSPGGAHEQYLLDGVCYSWNEQKMPAILKGIYSRDGIDSAGNEAVEPMNGAAAASLTFGTTDNNPNFRGTMDKTVRCGATKFRLDGASVDYLYDAMQIVLNGAALTVGFLVPAFKFFVAPAIREYADYALLLMDETASFPKILIWDGQSYENAKAVKPYPAYPLGANNNPPQINYKYNSEPWYVRHAPETFVAGSSLTIGSSPKGYYKVQDYWLTEISKQPAMLVNYPMYFNPYFEGTLWDLFHWVDDPKKNPTALKTVEFKLSLCKEVLDVLKVWQSASDIVLGLKCKVNNSFLCEAKIKEISVVYKTDGEYGQHVVNKGEM